MSNSEKNIWFCDTVFGSQLSQGWTAMISSVMNLYSIVTVWEKLGHCSPRQKAEQGSALALVVTIKSVQLGQFHTITEKNMGLQNLHGQVSYRSFRNTHDFNFFSWNVWIWVLQAFKSVLWKVSYWKCIQLEKKFFVINIFPFIF